MELKSSYPMLGLVSKAFPYRMPGPYYGKYGSLVMVAPCNMACPYCDMGGYVKDSNMFLPGWRTITLQEIEEFVDEEIKNGRIIFITGGEPLIFPELVIHLGKRIRELNGYSVVCSNATLGDALEKVAPYVDEFSISLKGRSEYADVTSGITGKTAFEIPLRNSIKLLDSNCKLEMVIVLFDFLELETIVSIYKPFIGKAHLILKEYRQKTTLINDDHTYLTEMIADQESLPLQPMTREKMFALYHQLTSLYPEHSTLITLVAGGGGEQIIMNGDSEYLFVR